MLGTTQSAKREIVNLDLFLTVTGVKKRIQPYILLPTSVFTNPELYLKLMMLHLFIPRGGYLVRPSVFEFWQGQTTRIHDRIRFRRLEADEVIDHSLTKEGKNGWVYERLAP